jgi:hypothetical protein
VLFDTAGGTRAETTSKDIFEFIEAAAKKTESVLVHSVRG